MNRSNRQIRREMGRFGLDKDEALCRDWPSSKQDNTHAVKFGVGNVDKASWVAHRRSR